MDVATPCEICGKEEATRVDKIGAFEHCVKCAEQVAFATAVCDWGVKKGIFSHPKPKL